jgi:hypothetical protein
MDENASKNDLRLIGAVVDEKGRSVSGAEVFLDEKQTRTLFDGSFLFEKLFPGSYELKIKLDGYQEQNRVVLLEEEDVNIELLMEPQVGTGKIMGYVISEESGLPPSEGGTVLMILPTNNKYVRINPEDGYYEFNNLAAGFYTITTSILEYEEEKEEYKLSEGEEKRIDFIVKKEEEEEVPWG